MDSVSKNKKSWRSILFAGLLLVGVVQHTTANAESTTLDYEVTVIDSPPAGDGGGGGGGEPPTCPPGDIAATWSPTFADGGANIDIFVSNTHTSAINLGWANGTSCEGDAVTPTGTVQVVVPGVAGIEASFDCGGTSCSVSTTSEINFTITSTTPGSYTVPFTVTWAP